MNQQNIQAQIVEAAMANWEMILGELEEIADEYERENWETIILRPGEIQLISNESVQTGFDVLLPDDEYREVKAALDAGVSFDTYEVYREVLDGVVHLIVVMEDTDTRTSLFYPIYYGIEDVDTIEEACRDGTLRTYLRRLNGEFLELSHSEPDLFAPPSE